MLQEYHEQLAQVKELLAEDPANPEYLQLQKDLLELITITQQGQQQPTHNDATNNQTETEVKNDERNGSLFASAADTRTALVAHDEPPEPAFPLSKSAQQPVATTSSSDTATAAAAATSKRKAPAVSSIAETFVVPPHLIPLESDTPAEQNRKRRTIKALKRQHKEKIKEIQAASKQQSWQQFSSKVSGKKGTKNTSIWRTSETRGVGVVSVAEGQGQEGASSHKRLKLG